MAPSAGMERVPGEPRGGNGAPGEEFHIRRDQRAWPGAGGALTCMPRAVALRVLAATSKSAHVFGAPYRIRSGLGRTFHRH